MRAWTRAGAIWIALRARTGELRPLGDVIADYFEARVDAMGDRFVGRVSITVDLLATPEPPPEWGDGS